MTTAGPGTPAPFRAVLQADDGPGCAFAIPFDVKAAFGRARAPVTVVVNGSPPFRTRVASYGGVWWIGLRKAQLAELGVKPGDTVTASVALDEEPRPRTVQTSA